MEENHLSKKDGRGEQMQESGNKGLLARELEQMLDWYITEASEEEYDEKAVEYILYLLDSLDPLDEDKIPQIDDAWQSFGILVERRRQQDLRDKEG